MTHGHNKSRDASRTHDSIHVDHLIRDDPSNVKAFDFESHLPVEELFKRISFCRENFVGSLQGCTKMYDTILCAKGCCFEVRLVEMAADYNMGSYQANLPSSFHHPLMVSFQSGAINSLSGMVPDDICSLGGNNSIISQFKSLGPGLINYMNATTSIQYSTGFVLHELVPGTLTVLSSEDADNTGNPSNALEHKREHLHVLTQKNVESILNLTSPTSVSHLSQLCGSVIYSNYALGTGHMLKSVHPVSTGNYNAGSNPKMVVP
ncbi:hypothetical protein ZIOFF_062827 [Zingiber officinale]|uniref:Uncharacterized protein n=1 Tax=Zingiber officinale TaxID=94328 RepID=A0A8J5F5K9_ZINOF|nr:hypothetical protein ZIOFF_062827 [Zingiber officinale]